MDSEIQHLNTTVIQYYLKHNTETTDLEISCKDDSELKTIDSEMLYIFNDITFLGLEIDECSKYSFPHNTVFLNHSKLEIVSITSSDINQIYAETFSNLTEILKIDLSENHIKKINSNIFRNNTKLESLIVDNNLLEKISVDVFENLVSFNELSMNSNPDFNFPMEGVFLNSKSLKIYKCANCGITTINVDTLTNMTNLMELNLNNNKLTVLEDGIFPDTLEELYLDQNQLIKFQINLLHVNMKILQLDGNSFGSSMENNEFVKIYKDRKYRENVKNNLKPFEDDYVMYDLLLMMSTTRPSLQSSSLPTTIIFSITNIPVMQNISQKSTTHFIL